MPSDRVTALEPTHPQPPHQNPGFPLMAPVSAPDTNTCAGPRAPPPRLQAWAPQRQLHGALPRRLRGAKAPQSSEHQRPLQR